MSFRTQVALLVAVLVALAAGAGAVTARVSAERELVEEIDDFLISRSATFTQDLVDRRATVFRPGRTGLVDPRRRPGDTALADADSVVQVVGPSGQVLISQEDGISLPVRAPTDAAFQLETVAVDGTNYRMITRPLPREFTVQVARDLTETEGALTGLQRRLVFGVVIVSAAAALLGWLLARRLTRPIVRLTAAAEEVARTQQLDRPVQVTGAGEVGRLADSFNTMLGELGTSRSQQQRLIEDAGHELRTPLTSLRTNIELLQNPALSDEDRAALLGRLQSEATELTTLVNEVVDLGTDSRSTEAFAPCDLVEIADTVAQRATRRSGRPISITGAPTAPVSGQPQMLDRAVHNLVDNALKFSPDGTVTVEVRTDGVTVHDEGPGVPEHELTLIFDRFHRADTSRDVTGSGLGLSIVKQVAEAHGGTVHAANRPTGGASVGFTVVNDGV